MTPEPFYQYEKGKGWVISKEIEIEYEVDGSDIEVGDRVLAYRYGGQWEYDWGPDGRVIKNINISHGEKWDADLGGVSKISGYKWLVRRPILLNDHSVIKL